MTDLRPKLAYATILGSGTSMGVPVIGCDCAVCKSTNPRNARFRSSIMVTATSGNHIVFDTSPEFRLQMLRAGVKKVQSVVYTHTHADHCHGFDDLRGLFFNQHLPVTCFLRKEDLEELRLRFAYAFEDRGYMGTKPQIILQELTLDPIEIEGLHLEPVLLPHGGHQTLGFKMGRFAYATDFKGFPRETLEKWRGNIDVMIASGLRFRPHNTHNTISETLALFEELGVKKGIITHLSHEVEYEADSKKLPPHVSFAYDGMRVDLGSC